jgi:hypothetical protein
MRYPSIKTLLLISDLTLEDAKAIRKVLQSTSFAEVLGMSTDAERYNSQCYHSPLFSVLKMYAINQLMRTYGVEGFTEKGITVDYCNTGETYALTLCRVNNRGKVTYRVTSWGDIVERMGL